MPGLHPGHSHQQPWAARDPLGTPGKGAGGDLADLLCSQGQWQGSSSRVSLQPLTLILQIYFILSAGVRKDFHTFMAQPFLSERQFPTALPALTFRVSRRYGVSSPHQEHTAFASLSFTFFPQPAPLKQYWKDGTRPLSTDLGKLPWSSELLKEHIAPPVFSLHATTHFNDLIY